MKKRLKQVIYDAVDKVNSDLPPNMKLQQKSSQKLLSDGGVIDSLGVVALFVELERSISQVFDIEFEISERLEKMPLQNPYDTLGSLTKYIAACLHERGVDYDVRS